jgi:hypothetical protein
MALRKMRVQGNMGQSRAGFFRYVPRSDVRTRVAGRSNAAVRTYERGWPDGRTRVAARSNAKIASAFALPADKSGRGEDNPLILHEASPGNPEISSLGPLRVRGLRPRPTAKYFNFILRTLGVLVVSLVFCLHSHGRCLSLTFQRGDAGLSWAGLTATL